MSRAETPEQKRDVVERLLVAWLKVPDLRLGQLVTNACERKQPVPHPVFAIEDTVLAGEVETFVRAVREQKARERD